MFSLNYKNFVKPELLKYIKERHNIWLQNYSNNYVNDHCIGLKVSDLVKQKNEKPSFSFYFILIGLISFLAGYNFRDLTKRINN